MNTIRFGEAFLMQARTINGIQDATTPHKRQALENRVAQNLVSALKHEKKTEAEVVVISDEGMDTSEYLMSMVAPFEKGLIPGVQNPKYYVLTGDELKLHQQSQDEITRSAHEYKKETTPLNLSSLLRAVKNWRNNILNNVVDRNPVVVSVKNDGYSFELKQQDLSLLEGLKATNIDKPFVQNVEIPEPPTE